MTFAHDKHPARGWTRAATAALVAAFAFAAKALRADVVYPVADEPA